MRKVSRFYLGLTGIFSLLLVFTGVALASYDYKFETRERSAGGYEKAIADKLTRGLTNVSMGWSEIGTTPVNWANDPHHGLISTVIVAIPYGITRAVGRTVVGAYEIATAFAPEDPIFYPLEGDKGEK